MASYDLIFALHDSAIFYATIKYTKDSFEEGANRIDFLINKVFNSYGSNDVFKRIAIFKDYMAITYFNPALSNPY